MARRGDWERYHALCRLLTSALEDVSPESDDKVYCVCVSPDLSEARAIRDGDPYPQELEDADWYFEEVSLNSVDEVAMLYFDLR